MTYIFILFLLHRGRISSVSSGGVGKAKNAVQSKIVKKNKIKQLRQIKYGQILEEKKALSTGATPPMLVVLIPLVPLETTVLQKITTLLEKKIHYVLEDKYNLNN